MSGAGRGGDGGQQKSARPEPRREPGVVDRAAHGPGYAQGGPVLCDVCGATMQYTAACKLKCVRCGYARDCSDP